MFSKREGLTWAAFDLDRRINAKEIIKLYAFT
jgi:hypothetical protein